MKHGGFYRGRVFTKKTGHPEKGAFKWNESGVVPSFCTNISQPYNLNSTHSGYV